MGFTTTTKAEVELHGYSDNPVYDGMCHKLASLAGLWRRHQTDEIAHQYQTLLRALIILGFDEELEVQIKLSEYLKASKHHTI